MLKINSGLNCFRVYEDINENRLAILVEHKEKGEKGMKDESEIRNGIQTLEKLGVFDI